MITELLGLAGSGVAGSIFGIFSDTLQARSENRRLELELIGKNQGQAFEHVKMVAANPYFSLSFLLLVATYCTATILCFIYPNVTVHTFNPDEEPKIFSILWGLFKWERSANEVYQLSTGGLGFSLLHPIAFQIGSVITGLNARR
jgi:hypothetical protein